MLPLGSVKGSKRLLAWFAESPKGTGLGSRDLPIKSWAAIIIILLRRRDEARVSDWYFPLLVFLKATNMPSYRN
jgi:hypothetical protein